MAGRTPHGSLVSKRFTSKEALQILLENDRNEETSQDSYTPSSDSSSGM